MFRYDIYVVEWPMKLCTLFQSGKDLVIPQITFSLEISVSMGLHYPGGDPDIGKSVVFEKKCFGPTFELDHYLLLLVNIYHRKCT